MTKRKVRPPPTSGAAARAADQERTGSRSSRASCRGSSECWHATDGIKAPDHEGCRDGRAERHAGKMDFGKASGLVEGMLRAEWACEPWSGSPEFEHVRPALDRRCDAGLALNTDVQAFLQLRCHSSSGAWAQYVRLLHGQPARGLTIMIAELAGEPWAYTQNWSAAPRRFSCLCDGPSPSSAARTVASRVGNALRRMRAVGQGHAHGRGVGLQRAGARLLSPTRVDAIQRGTLGSTRPGMSG